MAFMPSSHKGALIGRLIMTVKNYSEIKKQLIELMLSPEAPPLRDLARQYQVKAKLLATWRLQALRDRGLAPARSDPKDSLSPQVKFDAIVAQSTLNANDFGQYCRTHGLLATQVEAWKTLSQKALGGEFSAQASLNLAQENRNLKTSYEEVKKELHRKNKALAETAALLVLRKKARAIWGPKDEDEEV
jgi:transposase-like protein